MYELEVEGVRGEWRGKHYKERRERCLQLLQACCNDEFESAG